MLHLSTRRIAQSIAAAFVLTSGFATTSAFAQSAKGTTSASVQYKSSVDISPADRILPDGRVVYNTVEKMPEYPGDLQAFLISNLRYPETARKQKIEGKSIVKFIVSSDGSVSDIEIARSSGNQLLDDEAIRVAGLMEKWKPGVKDGYPVAVFYHLPISYKLD